MKQIQINIQSAILKSIRSFISVSHSSAYCSKIIKSGEYLELNYKRYTYLGIKQRRKTQ